MKVSGEIQDRVLQDVLVERKAQDAKWGEQNHDPAMWIAILIEEVGEFARAVLRHEYEDGPAPEIRRELVQVAAVALSMLECCDRNHWDKPSPKSHGCPHSG